MIGLRECGSKHTQLGLMTGLPPPTRGRIEEGVKGKPEKTPPLPSPCRGGYTLKISYYKNLLPQAY